MDRAFLRVPRNTRLLAAQYAATIAIGMGTAAAVLSLTLALGYAPLPFPSPGRVVVLWERAPSGSLLAISPPDMANFGARAHDELESLGGVWAVPLWLSTPDGTRRLSACNMQSGALRSLDFAPVAGRRPRAGDPPGTIWISYRAWQRWFGGRYSVVGTAIAGGGDAAGPFDQHYRIAGVFPKGASVHLPIGPVCSEAWLAAPDLADRSRRMAVLFGVGRLRPGSTAARAQQALRAEARDIAARYPFERGRTPVVEGMQAIAQGPARRTMGLLALGVGLVFLAGCINLAVLMVAEGVRRRSDIAIRGTLGASAWHLWGELAAEKCTLALISLGLGAGLAAVLVRGLARLVPAAGLGAPMTQAPPLNLYVIFGIAGFVIAGSLGWAALLMRAAGGWRSAPVLALGSPGISVRAGNGSGRWRSALLVAQAGVAVCVLAVAALATQAYLVQSSADLGPAPNETALVKIVPSGYGAANRAQQLALNRAILRRLGSLPRIATVALADDMPHGEGQIFRLASDAPGTMRETTRPIAVSEGYFKAFGIRLLRGRSFTSADENGGQPVAVINLAMARANWPEPERALGSEIVLGAKARYRIVGVVANFTGWWYKRPVPSMYLPGSESEAVGGIAIIRTAVPIRSIGLLARQALAGTPIPVTITGVRTMESSWRAELTRPLARMAGMLLLALLGVGLCAQGIYAVAAAAVASRRHELAVRAALGSRPRDLVWSAIGGPILAVAAGCALGVAAAAALLLPLLASWLGSPAGSRAASLAAVVAVLLLAAATGCLRPALAAARADPVAALREG